MKKIFSSLNRIPLLAVTNRIASLVSPEKIFLLSVIHRAEEAENIFLQGAVTDFAVESFNLLVLAAESEKRSNDQLQDIIEHFPAANTGLTVFVLPVQQFNDWLIKDHPFATRVYHEAELVYDADKTPLAIPNPYNEIAIKKLLGEMLATHTGRAIEFIAGAGLFIARKRYALAAFHLHQAAEQICSGIIWFITGLRVNTHNIDKLYRYCRHFLPAIQTVFPRDSGPEKELFQWLQRAYVDGRYNNDFTVKYLIVSQSSERVQKLLELCKTLPLSTTIHT